MLVDAALLIQDVQLLCFTIVFGVLALGRWNDLTRRWLWYSFLANTAGAIFDLLGSHLPTWISHGVNGAMIPLSYALLNVAIVRFDQRGRRAVWVSFLILAAGQPFLFAWRNMPDRTHSDSLGDLMIALEAMVTVALLLSRQERSTRAPRWLVGAFLTFFIGVELTRAGVAFLAGGNPDLWPRLATVSVVTYILNISLLPLASMWMMQARLEWELLRQTTVDPLTGMLNRRGLEQAMERELVWARRYGQDLTVAMLDLDHFKQLNDRYGHPAGDAVLTGVAQFLQNRLRQTDVVGRIGGEEFVLLFPNTDMAQGGPVLEEVCRRLRQHEGMVPSQPVRVTASFGVTSMNGRRAVSGIELLQEADQALYRAKESGRDQICYFDPSATVAFPMKAAPLHTQEHDADTKMSLRLPTSPGV
jgi:diguanylate cyclase (GGDEF)-like protein